MPEGRSVMRNKRQFTIVGMCLVVIGLSAAPVHAQELFVLPTTSGLEFYLVEGLHPAVLPGAIRSITNPSYASQSGQPIYSESEMHTMG